MREEGNKQRETLTKYIKRIPRFASHYKHHGFIHELIIIPTIETFIINKNYSKKHSQLESPALILGFVNNSSSFERGFFLLFQGKHVGLLNVNVPL